MHMQQFSGSQHLFYMEQKSASLMHKKECLFDV
jgi:hypothetical protein